MFQLIIQFVFYITLLVAKFFILFFPLKYYALHTEHNVVHSKVVSMVYHGWFLADLLFAIILAILLPEYYAILYLEAAFIVFIYAVIWYDKWKNGTKRIMFPTYKNDSVDYIMMKFMKNHTDAKYYLAANKSPLLITSKHETEEEFTYFLSELNSTEGLFRDLSHKNMRLLYKSYLLLGILALIYITLYPILSAFVYTIIGFN